MVSLTLPPTGAYVFKFTSSYMICASYQIVKPHVSTVVDVGFVSPVALDGFPFSSIWTSSQVVLLSKASLFYGG